MRIVEEDSAFERAYVIMLYLNESSFIESHKIRGLIDIMHFNIT